MRANLNGLKGGFGNTLDISYGNNSDVSTDRTFMRESDRRPVVAGKAIHDFGVSTEKSEQPFDVGTTLPISSNLRSAMMLNMQNLSQQPENQTLIFQFALEQLFVFLQEVALPEGVI